MGANNFYFGFRYYFHVINSNTKTMVLFLLRTVISTKVIIWYGIYIILNNKNVLVNISEFSVQITKEIFFSSMNVNNYILYYIFTSSSLILFFEKYNNFINLGKRERQISPVPMPFINPISKI